MGDLYERRRIVRIGSAVLAEVLRSHFRLPSDCQVMEAEYDFQTRETKLKLESAEFEPLPEDCQVYPEIPLERLL